MQCAASTSCSSVKPWDRSLCRSSCAISFGVWVSLRANRAGPYPEQTVTPRDNLFECCELELRHQPPTGGPFRVIPFSKSNRLSETPRWQSTRVLSSIIRWARPSVDSRGQSCDLACRHVDSDDARC